MSSPGSLFGPMLIGVFFNTTLYGFVILQTFIYYQTYKRDAPWLRYFVLYLLVAETANSALDIAMVYQPLILEYGDPDAATFFPLTLAADPIVTVFVSTPVQTFIAWRIQIISRSRWLAVIICIFAIISMAGGMWTGVTVITVRRFAKKPEMHWPALTWLLASAIADIIITTSLVLKLSCRKTGFTGTDDAINRIIRLTIQTGLVTMIFAILDVVFFLALPRTTLNFIWDFSLSKLYTNALLSTLNARAGWNKLANAHTRNNILFCDDVEPPTGTSQATSEFRIADPAEASDLYELDSTSNHARHSRHGSNKSHPSGELQVEITVTKSVETAEEIRSPYQ